MTDRSAANVRRVDLNADLGEGYGRYTCGDDAAMLRIVTTANVACGFHAGDPDIMAATFATAKANGVAVGAHPGFPDLIGFGRRRIPYSAAEIERLVAYQIGAAQAMAAQAGHRLTHVKAHGALANLAEVDADAAGAVARAVKAVDPSLACLCIALTEQVKAADAAGLRVVSEIFADRAYAEDGRLAPRGAPGAVIEDVEAVVARTLAMLSEGALITLSGARLPTPVDSICVHGDTPGAVAIARALRDRLEGEGVAVRAFA